MINEKVLIERLEERRKMIYPHAFLFSHAGGHEINDEEAFGRYSELGIAIEIAERLASEHNNGWIPCSERLPEDRQNVLITDSNGKVRQIVFNKWMYENPQYAHNIIPIAWQPLPAPYKKGE